MNADAHRWKTPQSPRGMPPSAWPRRRQELYKAAIATGDPSAPRPKHAPGECEECDIMRSLIDGAQLGPEPQQPASPPSTPDLGRPEVTSEPWPLERIGKVKMYPGSLALLLGMAAGIGLCTLAGPGWGFAVLMVLALGFYILA